VWNPSELEISLPIRQKLEIFLDNQHGIVEFEPEDSLIDVDLGSSGSAMASGTLSNVRIKSGEYNLTAHQIRVNAAPRPARRAGDTRLAVSLSMLGGVFDPTYRSPFGRVIRAAGIEAKLKGPFGTGALDREFDTWRRAGGRLQVEHAHLVWGPIDVSGSGTFGLNARHHAIGRVNLDVKDFNTTVNGLVDARIIQQQAGTWAKVAMSKTAVRRGLGDRAHVTASLPLTLKDNRISTGGVPLAILPVFTFR
jgi:hypothetical protein